MSGNMNQQQNILTLGGVGSLPGQRQGMRTNHTAMDGDSLSPPTHHTMTNMAPSPGLGNLQSVVGSTIPSQITHSTLATVLQSGNPMNVSTNISMAAPPAPPPKSNAVLSSGQLHDSQTQIVTRPRLHDLVREVDPTEQLDEEVEDLLLRMADDFVETTVTAACMIAKHRKASTIDVKDVQLHLERTWNMWIPGFGTDEVRPYKRSSTTEAHKQRLALIRKALKKY